MVGIKEKCGFGLKSAPDACPQEPRASNIIPHLETEVKPVP